MSCAGPGTLRGRVLEHPVFAAELANPGAGGAVGRLYDEMVGASLRVSCHHQPSVMGKRWGVGILCSSRVLDAG